MVIEWSDNRHGRLYQLARAGPAHVRESDFLFAWRGCNFAKNRPHFESAIPGDAQGLVGPACVVRQRRALGLSFIA
jgi:hypothetical protein